MAKINKPSEIQDIGDSVPFEIGGVIVKTGDIIVADENNLVAIPAEALGGKIEVFVTIF